MEKFSWAIFICYYIIPALLLGGFAAYITYRFQQRHEKFKLMYQIYSDANDYIIQFHHYSIFISTYGSKLFENSWQHMVISERYNQYSNTIAKLIATLSNLKELYSSIEIKKGVLFIGEKLNNINRLVEDISMINSKFKESMDPNEMEKWKNDVVQNIKEMKDEWAPIKDRFLEIQKLAFKEMKLIK